MPFERTYEAERQLLVMRAVGAGTLRDTLEGLRVLVGGAAIEARASLLLDLRGQAFLPSAPEAYAVASELAAVMREGGRRVAILTGPGVQYGCGRMIGTVAEMRGIAVHVFLEEAEALQWLGQPQEPGILDVARPRASG